MPSPNATRHADAVVECSDCGLFQRQPGRVRDGAVLVCKRCRALIRQVRNRSLLLSAMTGAFGLVLLGAAMWVPIASVHLPGGRFVTEDILGAIEQLGNEGAWFLVFAVALPLLVLPAFKLALVVAMAICARRRDVPGWLKRAFAAVPMLTSWGMVDVFLVGALIALFRLGAWGTLFFGPALLALGGVAVCSSAIDAVFDRRSFWRHVPPKRSPRSRRGARRLGCHHCGLVSMSKSGEPCPRCEQTLTARKPDSLGRTWALVAGATLFLIPANALPVMTVTERGHGAPSTILGGVVELADVGLWSLAVIVLVASVVVPGLKLVALAALLVSTQRGKVSRLRARTRLYRFVRVIGRWSMIDIFATMTLVALARFGWLGNVRPDHGATAFCVVVFLTMLAAESFDPRLMWDAADQNTAPPQEPTGPAHLQGQPA